MAEAPVSEVKYRRDRAPGRTEDENERELEGFLEGEVEESDPFVSLEDGTNTLAPDEMVPEGEK
jgi:hypothetical protein